MGSNESGLILDVPLADDVACEVDQLGVRLRLLGGRQGRDASLELRSEKEGERLRGFEELFEDGAVACWARSVDQQVNAWWRQSLHCSVTRG